MMPRSTAFDALGQASIVLVGAALVGGTFGFLVGALVSGAVPFSSGRNRTVAHTNSLEASAKGSASPER